MSPATPRQDFVLVRGPGHQERFAALRDLAQRIHQLRGERALHLHCFGLEHPDGDQGPCVSIRAGDDAESAIGWALFPQTLAYEGEAKRAVLAKALIDQVPEARRTFDGERLAVHGAPPGRDGEAGRSARQDNGKVA